MQIDLRLNRFTINIFIALIVSLFFVGCNSYKRPVSLEDASQDSKKGYVKVTYNNGDHDIFEKLEIENGIVYGINSKKNKVARTALKDSEIMKVEKQDRGVATRNTILGILVAGFAVYQITTML